MPDIPDELLQPFDPQKSSHHKLVESVREDLQGVQERVVHESGPPGSTTLRPGALTSFLDGRTSDWLKSVRHIRHPRTGKRHRVVGLDRIRVECPGCHLEEWRVAVVTSAWWVMDCKRCCRYWWISSGGTEGQAEAYREGRTHATYERLLAEFGRSLRDEGA